MDPRPRPGAIALLLCAALPAGAAGETLHRCTDADGGVTFTDRGCPAGTSLGPARVLHVEPDNVIGGGALTDADLAQLERIADRRASTGAGVRLVGRTTETDACRTARARLDAHRERARRPHARSLLARGRALRAAVRDACH